MTNLRLLLSETCYVDFDVFHEIDKLNYKRIFLMFRGLNVLYYDNFALS